MLSRVSGGRHRAHSSIRSSSVAPFASVWVSDAQLRQSFERFAAIVFDQSASAVSRKCIRHGSNVPGPLESRRRLLRRRLNDLALSSQAPTSISPPPTESRFALYRHIWPDFSLPRATWLPPAVKPPTLPDTTNSGSLPWWPDPSPEPPTYKPFNPSSDSKSPDFLKTYCYRLTEISISEYTGLLSECSSFRDVQRLHYDLSNALLDAPYCSSLAFQHLLAIRSALAAKGLEQTVTLNHLVSFLRDPKLEHTQGSNLSLLIPHLSLSDSSEPAYKEIFSLVRNGLQRNLFSTQALATLYANASNLQQLVAAADLFGPWETSENLINCFKHQLSTLSTTQTLPTSLKDLNLLLDMATTLSDPHHVASLARIVLETSLRGLHSTDISPHQLPSLLGRVVPLLKLSGGALQPASSTVATLREFLRFQHNDVTAANADALNILVPLLELTNSLPVGKATMTLTSDLIQEYAHNSSASTLPIRIKSSLRNALTQAAVNLLIFDKLKPPTVSTVYPARSVALISPFHSNTAHSEPKHLHSRQVSSLTCLMDQLPTAFVEAWFCHTSNALIKMVQEESFDENVNLLNAWLTAAAKSETYPAILYSEAWNSLFKRLSDIVRPVHLAKFFQTLRNSSICRILLRHWVLKDFYELLPAAISSANSSSSGKFAVHSLSEGSRDLQRRWEKLTATSLEHFFEYFKLQRSSRGRYDNTSARCFLCALKAAATLGLLLQQTLENLLELAHSMNRPIVFSALVDATTSSVGRRPFAQRHMMNKQIARYCFSNPGLALRLFKQTGYGGLWEQKDLLAALILSPKSCVHPAVILRQLCKDVPSTGRASLHHGGILSKTHIDAIHDAAMHFAMGARLSSWTSWECVTQLLDYLERHKAPLDRRMSKALVISGLLRGLTGPSAQAVPDDILRVCSRVVALIEGKEVAEAVLRLEHMWKKLQ